ncbi:hypothetical protein Dimus_034885 [Dionaea muscipula]
MDEDFLKIAKMFNAMKSVVRVPHFDKKYKIAVLASKQDHCLVDLLHGWQDGKLPVDITCVISNHERGSNTHVIRFLERHGIPYHYLRMGKGNKRESEILDLVQNTDFLVLARYMQLWIDGSGFSELGIVLSDGVPRTLTLVHGVPVSDLRSRARKTGEEMLPSGLSSPIEDEIEEVEDDEVGDVEAGLMADELPTSDSSRLTMSRVEGLISVDGVGYGDSSVHGSEGRQVGDDGGWPVVGVVVGGAPHDLKPKLMYLL